ncbi:MAG: YceI family protein [Betaproteobacteria bacterium]|nr:YceI family protein [Betaproteobacteria bacterium]
MTQPIARRSRAPTPALLAFCLFAALPAQAVEYAVLKPEASKISFVSRQMGVPVEGGFKRFGAQLSFDPAKPATSRTWIEIDLTSVDAGSREANEEVMGRNWFDTRPFPTARFESTALKALGGNRFEARGRLTVKGRVKEISAPFTFTESAGKGLFVGAFTFKRLEFGIGAGPWGDTDTVADEVQVKFQITAAPR